MCSILGLIDFENKINNKPEIVFKLNSLLKHRGPDDEGYFNDEFISLGFNRLSIIDLNLGNQPIVRNNIISIFNGEIYNFKELRSQLKLKGYNFLTNSDSEVINLAYQEWGRDFVKKFNGMFSIAIYDKIKKKIYLYRDRVGIKPLYYWYEDNIFIFSSELKAISNNPFFKKKPNISAIYSYLCFRYPTNNNLNFFKNIKRVFPGEYLEICITNKTVSSFFYWELPEPQTKNTSYSENYYAEKLDYLLKKSVKSQMMSDVPIGVFLSGGLDSSLIASIANNFSSKKINTFSVRFEESGYDESKKTEMMQKFLDSNHFNLTVTKGDFFNNLSEIVKIKDSPLSIPHEYPLYSLTKQMKGKVKVVLSGEGADEFFGGYSRVQKSPFDYKKGEFIKSISNLKILEKIFNLDKNFDFKNENFSKFFFNRYKWFGVEEAKNLLTEDALSQVNFEKVFMPWEENFSKENKLRNLYSSVLKNFQKNHLSCLLDRLDIMTMANSIEARVPFLDHELIEFINSVPFHFKIKWKSKYSMIKSIFSNSENYTEKYDINKYLLRNCSRKYLPKKISKEKKLGFPLPMNEWMKDGFIKNMLLDKKTIDRGIFKKKELENLFLFNDKIDTYDFNGKKIWMVLNIELWFRHHFGN